MTVTNESSKHDVIKHVVPSETSHRGKTVSEVAELTELVDVMSLHTTLCLRRRGKNSGGGFSKRPRCGGSGNFRQRRQRELFSIEVFLHSAYIVYSVPHFIQCFLVCSKIQTES